MTMQSTCLFQAGNATCRLTSDAMNETIGKTLLGGTRIRRHQASAAEGALAQLHAASSSGRCLLLNALLVLIFGMLGITFQGGDGFT